MALSCSKRARWEDMNPEVLGLIFVRLPADVVLRSVPFVCRSWHRAVAEPYCWEEIDLQQWCRRVNREDLINAAIRRLVRRSAGSLRRLSAYKIGDPAFSFTAQRVKCLKVLQIPVSEVSDTMVEAYPRSLKMLTTLDISYCMKITHRGIGMLGNNCPSLVHLRRNMPPHDIELTSHAAITTSCTADETEALAVASTMPNLRHLELSYGRFSDIGLQAILECCKFLIVLDIRGCWNVNMDGPLADRCDDIPDFRGLWYDEYEDA